MNRLKSVLDIGGLVGSTLSAGVLIASFVTPVDKMKNDELTALDLYQFTLSVLFFTHDVMNMTTASTIIKEL